MARRNDHSRAQIYDLVMSAARQIVETDGYKALSARSVADAIGYSAGTLYNVFENLDDLILHLNGTTLDALRIEVANIPLTGNPFLDLDCLLECYLAFLEEHPNLWRAITDFSVPQGNSLPDWYTQKVQTVLSVVERALAPAYEGIEARNINDSSPFSSARVLWAGLHGICSLSDAGKLDVLEMGSVRSMAKILTKNFIAGIEARKTSDKAASSYSNLKTDGNQ